MRHWYPAGWWVVNYQGSVLSLHPYRKRNYLLFSRWVNKPFRTKAVPIVLTVSFSAESGLFPEHFLKITGVEVVVGTAGADEMRNPPEELFDHFMKAYRPYLSDQRTFVRKNTDRISPGVLQPEFSYEIFERCMTFAASVDWGKTLFCVSS